MTNPDAKEKLRQLYELYEQPMYRIAWAILHQREQAEDAVSDAFLNLMRHLHQIGAADSEETKRYVVQTIRSTAINQYRKNQREAARLTSWDETVLEMPDKTGSTEAAFAQAEQAEAVDQLLDSLNENERTILLLRCRDNLSFREIAMRLSIRESTARKRFERARKNAYRLKGEADDETEQYSF